MEGHVGFRFHPTEEEIIMYFLERKMRGLDFPVRTIEDVVDVCMYEPWDLPQRSPMPKEDRVWYFFNAPVPKYANSKRINRTTNSGFWKVTGRDRSIWDTQGKKIGFKKNLVFHQGRVPNGIKTNWVIHEYHSHKAASFPKEYVLFRLKRKSGDKPDTQEVEEFETSEQEVAFVNSLLADQGECSGEIIVNTLLQDFSPTKPLSGVYVQDSSDMNMERVCLQGKMLETSGLFNKDASLKRYPEIPREPNIRQLLKPSGMSYKNASSKGYSEMSMFRARNESTSSSGDAIMELDISSVNSCLEGVDELPTNTRTCKAQHTPEFHVYFEAQCSTQELQRQSKVSHKAIANFEKGENSIVKFGKDKQVAQTTSARTSLKSSSSSDRAGSNNKKGSFISLETPQLSHRTNPPSVYLFNVLVSLVLIIFIIREMVYLH